MGNLIEYCNPGYSSSFDQTSWFLLPFILWLQRASRSYPCTLSDKPEDRLQPTTLWKRFKGTNPLVIPPQGALRFNCILCSMKTKWEKVNMITTRKWDDIPVDSTGPGSLAILCFNLRIKKGFKTWSVKKNTSMGQNISSKNKNTSLNLNLLQIVLKYYKYEPLIHKSKSYVAKKQIVFSWESGR